MNILTKLMLIISVTAMFAFSGCQSNNSESPVTIAIDDNTSDGGDDNTTVLTIDVTLSTITTVLTQNSQTSVIDIRVIDDKNLPYSQGVVKIEYPDDVRNGRLDIGGFINTEITPVNGLARFEYIAPNQLDANTSDIVFEFYHESNYPGRLEYTFTIDPPQSPVTLTNYEIVSSSDSLTMNLNEFKYITFGVKDDQDNFLDDDDMVSVEVSVLNPALATLKNTDGDEGSTITTLEKNNFNLSLNSNTISGVVPIRIIANFKDTSNNDVNLSKFINVVIFSGPPTAISLAYDGTSHDEGDVKFKESIVVMVTDRYFNRVNTNPALSGAVIVGYAEEVAGNFFSRVSFEPDDFKSATMKPSNNTLVTTADLSNVDLANDILMTYGSGYTYQVSGKWDMSAINGNEITLTETIPGTADVSNIGFAIGHNYRQDQCRNGEWVGSMSFENPTLNSNGLAKIFVTYDYYLTGKTIALSIDMIGDTNADGITSRFGEVLTHNLRGIGFESPVESIPAGADGYTVGIPFLINETAEWYRNANFGYTYTLSDNLELTGDRAQQSEIDIVDLADTNTTAATDTMSVDIDGVPYSITGPFTTFDAIVRNLNSAINKSPSVRSSYTDSVITIEAITPGTPFSVDNFSFTDGGDGNNFDGLITTPVSNQVAAPAPSAIGNVGSCNNGGVAYVEMTVNNTGDTAGTITISGILIGSEL